MVAILFRFIILSAIIVLIYSVVKYFMHPSRQLEQAEKNRQFYVLDSPENVHKNILITYKGTRFEGEKHLGTTEKSLDVTLVSLWAAEPERLAGFEKNDFYFIEREVLTRYPHATIKWKTPIDQLMK